jgi:hypothetical protein
VITTSVTSEYSDRAKRLLSASAYNALVRHAAVAGGEEWIATALPRRFTRAEALALGYQTSAKRSRIWASIRSGGDGEPMTYDEKKRYLQGHTDPIVYTGRLRSAVFAAANATATATKGAAYLKIRLGPLTVQGRDKGQEVFRQLPADNIARRTLLAPLPQHDQDTVGRAYARELVARVDGLTGPRKRLPAAPPIIADRQKNRADLMARARAQADASQNTIAARTDARRQATASRLNSWRNQSGGSAPIGNRAPLSPAERADRHRMQSAAWYRRHRASFNAARRLRYRRMQAVRVTMNRAVAGARRVHG